MIKATPDPLIGKRFGKLTVLSRLPRKNGHSRILCKCDCGNLHEVDPCHLKDGHTRSCRKCKTIVRENGYLKYIDKKGDYFLFDECDLDLIKKYMWSVNSKLGYAYSSPKPNGKRELLHRYLLGFPDAEIDHINGNPRDNRRKNLRICSHSENLKNTKMHYDNRSGFKGVYFSKDRNKYRARITVDGKSIYLGQYDTAEEGGRAYDRAAVFYFGEFARLNFPRKEEEINGREKEQTLLEVENPLVYQQSWGNRPGTNALP